MFSSFSKFSYSGWLSRLTLIDWYDWPNSIDREMLRKGLRNRIFSKEKVNQIEDFQKKGQRNRRSSNKGSAIYWVDRLILLNRLRSCRMIDSAHMYHDWIDWYIQVTPIHGDLISTFSHIAAVALIVLAWLSYTSLFTGHALIVLAWVVYKPVYRACCNRHFRNSGASWVSWSPFARASPNMLTRWPLGHPVPQNGHPVMQIWPSSGKPCSSIFFSDNLVCRVFWEEAWYENSSFSLLFYLLIQFYYFWIRYGRHHAITSTYAIGINL